MLLAATSQSAAPTTLVGVYQGGGRACYGQLRIHKQTLSWKTPFNICKETRFSMTGLGKDRFAERSLFRLEARQPGCSYQSLVLTQRFLVDGQVQWEVTGYANEADRTANRLANTLSCPLVRIK